MAIQPGFNLFIRREFARTNLTTLAYSYGINRIRNELGIKTARDFDRTHSLALNTIFRLKKNITISALWRYHSGDPYTPTQIQILGDSTLHNSKIHYEVDTKNSARLPAYHSLDVRFEKQWQIGQVSLAAYLNIINLYNRKNINNFVWESNGTESVRINKITNLFLTDRNLLGTTPSLGIILSF